MQVGTPGNLDKGFCLKCKQPLMVELPDRIRYLCPNCVREVKELVKSAKGNDNIKKIVLQPGEWRRVFADGKKAPLVDVLPRRKRK